MTTLTSATPRLEESVFNVRVLLALLAVYIIWGSTYLGLRIGIESFPPFLLIGIRFTVAGAAMLAVMRLRGATMPTARQWRNSALVGALMLGGGVGLVTFSEQWVASGLAALIVAVMPLWAAVFAMLFGQRSTRREWLGLLIGFSGVVILNLGGDISGNPLGTLAILCAPIAWSFGSVLSQRLDMPKGMTASGAEMFAGGLLILAFSVLTGERLTAPPSVPSLLALVYLITFGSWIAYSAYVYLLEHVRPTLATSYAYVNPIVAMLLGVVLGGETVGVLALVAMPVILVGVALIALRR